MNLLTINNAIGILAQCRPGGAVAGMHIGEELAIALDTVQPVAGRYTVDQIAAAMTETKAGGLSHAERLAFEAVAAARNGG
ncbi:hypothetical protein ACXYMO_04770 [Arenibacterium sp. CAU 1754]